MTSKPLIPMALAIAALAAGCGGGGATKAGTTDDATVLKLANAYTGLEREPAVKYFVDRVQERSGGALRIELEDEFGGFKPDVEQQVVSAVADGKVDLGWVGTRIFGTLGVSDFQALTAPMLIDSHAVQRAVMRSDIPDRMLGRLDGLGVDGLALLGGAMRKPIAVEHPLLAPDDWRGITFVANRSEEQAEAIGALGAKPGEEFDGNIHNRLDAGQVQGFEKSLRIYRLNELEVSAPYVTANVNLWPETLAILANPERLDGLGEREREWLRAAARDAAEHSVELADEDATELATACGKGARFANASESDLAALRRSLAPVNDRLRQDANAGAYMAEIERLKQSAGEDPALTIPAACGGAAQQSVEQAPAASKPGVLDGTYRVSWTKQELLDAGATADYAEGVGLGLATMTLDGGELLIRFAEDPLPCGGRYTVAGDEVTIALTTDCHGTTQATYELAGDELRLEVSRATDPGDKLLFGAKPWKKIS